MLRPQLSEEMLDEQMLKQQFYEPPVGDGTIIITSTPDISIVDTPDITIEDVI